jgi:hypothetical protein
MKASHKKGNGMLGIYIHKKKDSNGKTSKKGSNPFDNWEFTKAVSLRQHSSTYRF